MTSTEILSHPLRLKFNQMSDDVFIQNFDQIKRGFSFTTEDKKKSKRNHEEDDIQVACVRLFNSRYPYLYKLFYQIKNDGYKKRMVGKNGKTFSPQANLDKARGIVSGVADTILSLPNKNYSAAYCEFKTPIGTQSAEQKKFERFCTLAGYQYVIIRSTTEFDVWLTDYMATVSEGRLAAIRQAVEEMDREEHQKIL